MGRPLRAAVEDERADEAARVEHSGDRVVHADRGDAIGETACARVGLLFRGCVAGICVWLYSAVPSA